MDERTLRVLEFDKIVKKLLNLATSDLGKELVEEIKPEKDYNKIQSLLKETNDGVSCIMRRGSPPLAGINDIRGSLKRVEIGGLLNPGELLKIADTLRAARNLKNYVNDNIEEKEQDVVIELIHCLEANKRVEDKIKLCIVNEEEISDYASPALADIRRKIKEKQNSTLNLALANI